MLFIILFIKKEYIEVYMKEVDLDYLKVAENAAREAGRLLRENLGRVKDIRYKAKHSLVTEVDTLSEDIIIKSIKSNFPTHDIFAEESGRVRNKSSHVWIIDPLDGTTNYAHTYPCFAVSIALEVEGIIRLGIVYDPIREEFFSAELGRCAYLNGKSLEVSKASTLDDSLLCTGFTHENEWMVDENLRHFENFIRKSQAVRRDGSAALDLCYVASGRYDGFWELGLHSWDTAAGSLIIKESGGMITDFSGREFNIYGEETLATNGLIHSDMIGVLSFGRKKGV
ncbi:MAG: inositol monophosphatase [Candidatus Dadabacteria bacterium]|nr:inositol monophosphatase [Candidatus Dadabacteria bacterium]